MTHHSESGRRARGSRPVSTLLRGVAAAVLAVAGVGLIAGCQSTPDEQMEMGEAANVPAQNFAVQWRADLAIEEEGLKSLTLAGDRLIGYTDGNTAYFVSPEGGSVLAQVRAARPRALVFEPFAAGDNIVLPSTRQLNIFTRDGKPKHRLEMSLITASSGVTGDETILVFGVDNPTGGRAIAVENKPQIYGSLPPVWELMTRAQVTATPATFDEGVYVGSRDGGVYAVRLGDREGLWASLDHGRFLTGGPILANVKADQDGVYVASMDGKLYGLDRNSGRVKWTYYSGETLREESTPVATGSAVYIYVPRRGVAAVTRGTNQEIRQHDWIVEGTRQFLAADAQNVYLRTNDNAILAVDRQSGKAKFKSKRNDFIAFASNTADNGLIYAATADGKIYGIRPVLKPGTVGEMALAE